MHLMLFYDTSENTWHKRQLLSTHCKIGSRVVSYHSSVVLLMDGVYRVSPELQPNFSFSTEESSNQFRVVGRYRAKGPEVFYFEDRCKTSRPADVFTFRHQKGALCERLLIIKWLSGLEGVRLNI